MADVDPIRVLVVDDDPAIVELLKFMLSLDRHFEIVMSSESGEEALELFERERPDVVLLDFRLPGMNGVQTARMMKGLYPKTKIVMVTGCDEDDHEFSNLESRSTQDIEAIISKQRFSLERLQEAIGTFGDGVAAASQSA